jgi:hypothetical protein
MTHKAKLGCGRGLILSLVGVLGTGCSYTYNPLSSAPGTLTFNTPPGELPPMTGSSPVMPGGAIQPPPGMQATAMPPAVIPQTQSLTRPASGNYNGTGVLIGGPDGNCRDALRITNWIVTNDQVSFGAFNGVIQPDGSLMMQGGPTYVQGRFIGSHFTGRVWSGGPSCSYSLSLDPVA